MRYYPNLIDAVNETEREMFEMGIDVTVQSMQDKQQQFQTKELQAYGFQVSGREFDREYERAAIKRWSKSHKNAVVDRPSTYVDQLCSYIDQEFADRTSGNGGNPGNSWKIRPEVWEQFLHEGKFAYTYAERFAVQLKTILQQLHLNPGTRQAIVTMHSNINADWGMGTVDPSQDLENIGGTARIPCSMYYQFLRREGGVDLIYTMRSCDYLTHFGIDLVIAHRLMGYVAAALEEQPGRLTYFAGSLHAYSDDIRPGIF